MVCMFLQIVGTYVLETRLVSVDLACDRSEPQTHILKFCACQPLLSVSPQDVHINHPSSTTAVTQ